MITPAPEFPPVMELFCYTVAFLSGLGVGGFIIAMLWLVADMAWSKHEIAHAHARHDLANRR